MRHQIVEPADRLAAIVFTGDAPVHPDRFGWRQAYVVATFVALAASMALFFVC